MQARYYDPVLGRFLSNDPVGFAEGGPQYFNRYMYTTNDPVNAIDPDGREICLVGDSCYYQERQMLRQQRRDERQRRAEARQERKEHREKMQKFFDNPPPCGRAEQTTTNGMCTVVGASVGVATRSASAGASAGFICGEAANQQYSNVNKAFERAKRQEEKRAAEEARRDAVEAQRDAEEEERDREEAFNDFLEVGVRKDKE